MNNTYIEFRNVSFRYSEEQPWVLNNVSFCIPADRWVAIIGHNGSGKSTIAKLINGLLFPVKGEIIVNGITVTEETVWEVRKAIGMVFQNPDNQFVGTTVRDDVAFGLENRGVERQKMISKIKSSLEAVSMWDYRLHEPHRLSGGQKQRVAIGGVLAVSPQVIILDEATAMLDPKGRKEIMQTVNNVRLQQGISLISITHDLNEITQADQVIVMNKGEVWLEASPREVFQKEKMLQKIGLDIPFVAKLANEINKDQMILEKQPLNQEELIEGLWTYHSKM
ncbi:Energy-coupling factor transporter ATP-binding protein EcfA1 [Paraliobacillus sp. PM-2]|uniref:energy-coupling factor ABC transporter ATP-binding protein n=1 Tax=Paraliobacillus sp. PM-2 TaxID=1462524 RepID=UPI00061C22A1|nr:energy-coupling factor ABC transporter ATP-binding protein [Paraliobacillus sp. PM-2]CQR48494.1 Energy-coupling factor transporter ATP-binding protein EcfA1 [Paraliobacillus sp. PM-2]